MLVLIVTPKTCGLKNQNEEGEQIVCFMENDSVFVHTDFNLIKINGM